MNIALLTLPLNGRNYGGTIQCYALSYVLKKMGHNVMVLDRRKNRTLFLWRMLSQLKQFLYKKVFCIKGKYFDWDYVCQDLDRFISDNIIVSQPLYSTNSLKKEFLHGHFDAVIFGSDQIWRKAYVSSILDFWGGFIPNKLKVKRIVYAASFGTDRWEYSEGETQMCRRLASFFNAISVREQSGIELCKKNLGVQAIMLIDPSFLLDKDNYMSLLDDEDRCLPETALSAYILDMTPEKEQVVSWIGEQRGTDFILRFSIYDYEEEGRKKGIFKYPSISKWLTVYAKSSFVITDSYHGCIFSILFNKPFVVIANPQRGLARFTSLLTMFGLQNRIVYSLDDLLQHSSEIMKPIDYDAINIWLSKEREKSFKFLSESLSYGK